MNQLQFRLRDGSFSVFGKKGSIWLTAFAAKSLASAKAYIDIDSNIIRTAKRWILSQQRRDGSFQDIHPFAARNQVIMASTVCVELKNYVCYLLFC